MTFKQRGLLPVVSRLVGLGLVLFWGCGLLYGLGTMFQQFLERSRAAQQSDYVPALAVFVLFASLILYAYIVAGAFPTLTVTAAGLVVRHPLGEKHTFQWTEIERVTTRSKHLDGVVLSAKGAPFWWPWRLYRYYVYGMFVHYLRPGILIAGKREHRAELIATIQQHLDQKPTA